MDLEKRSNIYQIQAGWTRGTRNYLYRQAGVLNAARILEVGSGTGTIISELDGRLHGNLFGVDIDLSSCQYTHQKCAYAGIAAANGLNLPFRDQTFDVTLCHYYLIWTQDIQKAMSEMLRVTKSGGRIIIASESDYEGIIEYPDIGLKNELIRNLKSEGMRKFDTGRRLLSLIGDKSEIIEAGVISHILNRFEIGELIDDMMPGNKIRQDQLFFQPIFYLLAKKY
jgi:SAM-dependent methyltransferase